MDPRKVFLQSDGTWRTATTTAATVKVIDNFRDYCRRLHALFTSKATKKIFLVGMDFNYDIRLDDATLKATDQMSEWVDTLGGTLQAAVKRGVQVRMLWSDGAPWRQPASDGGRILGIDSHVDKQMVDRPFHQKAVYVSPGDGPDQDPILFVGGADIAADRENWFDVMAEVSGKEGADLGLATLEERWMSTVTSPGRKMAGNYYVPKAKSRSYSQGQTLIQFVRAYGLAPGDKVKRMYQDDDSNLRLVLKAIESAKKFIYLEDQFFARTKKLDEALANAVNKVGGPVVVVISAWVDQNEQKYREVRSLRGRTARKNGFVFLRFKGGSGRPNLIHTKTWIVDDEFAIVGSANYWGGSFNPPRSRLDSEFGVGMMIPDLTSVRIRLWNRLIAAVPGSPSVSASGDFLDQLATLMDRTRTDLKANTAHFLTTGSKSAFEAIPDKEP